MMNLQVWFVECLALVQQVLMMYPRVSLLPVPFLFSEPLELLFVQQSWPLELHQSLPG